MRSFGALLTPPPSIYPSRHPNPSIPRAHTRTHCQTYLIAVALLLVAVAVMGWRLSRSSGRKGSSISSLAQSMFWDFAFVVPAACGWGVLIILFGAPVDKLLECTVSQTTLTLTLTRTLTRTRQP
jgi:hypothetical protein